LSRLRGALGEAGVEALLLSNATNLRWLIGFTGSHGYALVTPDAEWLAVDGRYALQAAQECPGTLVRPLSSSADENITDLIADDGCTRLGVEADALTVAALDDLRARAGNRLELTPVRDVARKLRMVKDDAEVAVVQRACRVVDEVFTFMCGVLRPGLSEREAMLEIEWRIRKHHGAEVAFPTIVVSGDRAAMPHGQPSDRELARGDFVTLDYGARVEGYCSDITRTVVLSAPSVEQRRVYELVRAAQARAIAAIRAGVPARAVDAEARDVIAHAGYGDRFTHGLGHSLGLDVHDGPGMNARSDFDLAAGMVMTVEPGVYLDGWGGVRIEDDVAVATDRCNVLTTAPRDLVVL
jgi:Xaa-Pro aminopeptidase